MIRYNKFDIKIIEEMRSTFDHFSIEFYEDDVWKKAREFEHCPCFENIIIELYFSELVKVLERKYNLNGVDTSYDVNCADSSLYVYGDMVTGVGSLQDALECNGLEL